MRLALAAGRPEEVDVLARQLSARQLAEWEAFEVIEGGIGGRAVFEALSMATAMYAEAHRDPKKRATAFAPKDFLPWLASSGPKMTPAAFRAQFKVLPKKRG